MNIPTIFMAAIDGELENRIDVLPDFLSRDDDDEREREKDKEMSAYVVVMR